MTVPQIAVVGCGAWGANLVRCFAGLDALASVSDENAAAANRAADASGAPVRHLDDVLGDDAVAAVVIATPASLHAELARQAILAGKDVFVEKPLALDAQDAERLVRLADERRRVLMVGHLMHYHPAFIAVKRLVSEGELGRLQYVYSNRLNLGRFRREESILWSFAPHDISMILGLVGAEPERVTATGSMYLHRQIADVTMTHLDFPAGERAHVFVSWLHPYKEQKLVVVGDRAMAVFDDGEPWERKVLVFRHRIDWQDGVPEAVRADAEALDIEPQEPLVNECRHFLDCIRTRAQPITDGDEGIRVLRVLDRAHRSLTRSAVSGDIDSTAIVDPGVRIGEGTKVWHFSHLMSGTTIGRDCTIGQNVVIGPDVSVGNGCKIQNNVSVFQGVHLADGVFCGPSAVFTNVLTPRAEVSRREEFLDTFVGRGATIGANATIVCGNKIGAYAMVGAGAVVTADVPPHALVVGVPARQVGWVAHSGEVLGDDLLCRRTGQRYGLVDGVLVERP